MRCGWWAGLAGVLAVGCGGTPSADDAGRVQGTDASGARADAAGLDAPGLDASEVPASDAHVEGDAPGGSDAFPPRALRLPPANGSLDYQLGGPYGPPPGVEIVSRDRTASPAPGLYNICYVNGFQTQPGEEPFWLEDHPTLVLRDSSGAPVIDPDWDEMLLDVTTPAKRAELAAVVGDWIAGCALAGFDAVEIDNLDTYSRSGGLIDQEDAVAFMRLLSDRAHAEGIAIAQKNSGEIVDRRAEMGTDFAVVEECNRYSECDVFTGAYGDRVLIIEYRRADFDRGCAAYPELSIVLRDLNLTTPGDGAYVYDGC